MDTDARGEGPGIPRALWSAYSGAPFETCVSCGIRVLEPPVPHAVEKVYRQGEVVFEYALCEHCALALLREFSRESLERIQAYMEREGPRTTDTARLLAALGWNEEDELPPPAVATSCERCGRGPEQGLEEYTVMGFLVGRRPATDVSLICGTCTEGLEDLLSQKTREAHDDFVTRHFPGVPAHLDFPVGTITI